MTIRSGVDILDIPKFAENLKSKAFIQKVFTPDEITVCEAAANSIYCYAAKFAVKEALMKAIGQGIRQEVWFTQIEVSQKTKSVFSIHTTGKTKQVLSEIKEKELTISMSHNAHMMIAVVIMECTD